jgi:hypothetical protein
MGKISLGKYGTLLLLNFISGLFFAFGIMDPNLIVETTFLEILRDFDAFGFIKYYLTINFIIAIIDLIFILLDRVSIVLVILGFISGFLIGHNWVYLGAFFLIIGGLISAFYDKTGNNKYYNSY